MFHRCLQQTTRPSVNGGWLWAGLILGLAVLNSKASAAVTLTAVADGYAIDGGVFVRDGVFDALESDSGGLVFGIDFIPGHSESAEYRTMLEYSLSGFSPSTVIQFATLDLKPFISPVGANQVDIFGYVGNGTVELADALADTLVSSRSFGSSFFGPLRFDVTTILQERVAAGDSFAGLGVRVRDTGSPNYFFVSFSLESNPLHDSPILIVETFTPPGDTGSPFPPPGAATPEPVSLVLWGLGALGCTLGAYRRRNACRAVVIVGA
jgi:hypothetical protein